MLVVGAKGHGLLVAQPAGEEFVAAPASLRTARTIAGRYNHLVGPLRLGGDGWVEAAGPSAHTFPRRHPGVDGAEPQRGQSPTSSRLLRPGVTSGWTCSAMSPLPWQVATVTRRSFNSHFVEVANVSHFQRAVPFVLRSMLFNEINRLIVKRKTCSIL